MKGPHREPPTTEWTTQRNSRRKPPWREFTAAGWWSSKNWLFAFNMPKCWVSRCTVDTLTCLDRLNTSTWESVTMATWLEKTQRRSNPMSQMNTWGKVMKAATPYTEKFRQAWDLLTTRWCPRNWNWVSNPAWIPNTGSIYTTYIRIQKQCGAFGDLFHQVGKYDYMCDITAWLPKSILIYH